MIDCLVEAEKYEQARAYYMELLAKYAAQRP